MVSVSRSHFVNGALEGISEMSFRRIRPRSFQSFEQIDLLIPPGYEENSITNNLEKADFSEFKRPGDLGSYLGYEA
jgi:hypothetical protein